MIRAIWDDIVDRMRGIGWVLDPSEADSLMDRHYRITQPGNVRDDEKSTTSCIRVVRNFRIRLQFRDKKDAFIDLEMAEAVEAIIRAMFGAGHRLLYESSAVESRDGGYIVDVEYSALDGVS